MRVVHFINQFFANMGGEDTAGMAPTELSGPIGPGQIIESYEDGHIEVVATIACGDNYFAEHQDDALSYVLECVERIKPDALIAGPAFNSGRYGMSCAAVCKAVENKLNIPAVTGLFEENPAVGIFHGDITIARTGHNARKISADLQKTVKLLIKKTSGERLDPQQDEYFAMGRCQNIAINSTSAQRALDMIEDIACGRDINTEIPLPTYEKIEKARLNKRLEDAKIVLITDGGLYPEGNPDKMPSVNANDFRPYSIDGMDGLMPGEYIVRHVGYDSSFVEEDPNRLVPVDALRELEAEGKIGEAHGEYLSTTGVAMSLENSISVGKRMAQYILHKGIDAAILTST